MLGNIGQRNCTILRIGESAIGSMRVISLAALGLRRWAHGCMMQCREMEEIEAVCMEVMCGMMT